MNKQTLHHSFLSLVYVLRENNHAIAEKYDSLENEIIDDSWNYDDDYIHKAVEEIHDAIINNQSEIKYYLEPKWNSDFTEKSYIKDVNSVMVYLGETDGVHQCYAPVGQHSEIKDVKYLDECIEITKEAYMEISKSLYTPKEYL